MKGPNYLTLLRGINVGGKNLIKMADLRAAFEAMGFADVSTYIASGNVLFNGPRRKREELAEEIERELTSEFGIDLRVVVITAAQLRKVVNEAPDGFGAPGYRCDVLFLRKPLTPAKAIAVAETKEGVDQVWKGPGVLYFSRLDARASSSRMGKIMTTPVYKDMTIRSWSTTTRLHALMNG